MIAVYTVIIKAAGGLIIAEGISHIKWTNLRRPRTLRSFDLHDQASRGPWGALMLLWDDKGRNISSLGAIVTILILILEPFSQQMVGLYDCTLDHELQKATIPIANMWSSGPANDMAGTEIPWQMRQAANLGIFATKKPQVRYICPSGNCTFPVAYSTLGFCSSCQDISSQLVPEYNPNAKVQARRPPIITLPTPPKPKNGSEPGPEETLFPQIALPDLKHNLRLNIVEPELTKLNQTSAWIPLIAQGMPTIDVIRGRYEKEPPKYFDMKEYVAYSCKIDPCVKSYSAEITNNILRETENSQERMVLEDNHGVADLNCMDNPTKELLRDIGYDLGTNRRWLPYNVTVQYDEKLQRVAYSGSCEGMSSEKISKYCKSTLGGYTSGNAKDYNLTDKAAQAVPLKCL